MELDLQLLCIAALAGAAGLGLGAIVASLLRLRQVAKLQQQLHHRDSELERSQADGELLRNQSRGRLRALRQQEIKLGILETQLAHSLQQQREREAQLEQQHAALAQLNTDYSQLRQDLTREQTEAAARERQHAEQLTLLNETRVQLKQEFENLANRIFEDKGRSFNASSQASLESLLKPFREQISGFQQRVNEVHLEAVKGQGALEHELKRVLDVGLQMSDQASNLTRALKGDKKTTGNWGEAQLERTLELAGLVPGEHYETQTSHRDEEGKRKLPDLLIKLPQQKHLVIDSKVSLVAYDRAIAADDDSARAQALAAHSQAVRRHIDELGAKDYANLPGIGSPDFVLMFMPIEPAYIEAMKHSQELFNYGYQKGVIMVSHTTLMPILRTVANLWMVENSHREARLISNQAGAIYKQVCRVAERLHKLGGTLRAANNHYNDAVKSLVGKQGLHGKVERFAQMSTANNSALPVLEPIHSDIDSERLLTETAPGELTD